MEANGTCNLTSPSMPPDSGEKNVVTGMLSFFSILGTCGNALVLYVYSRKRTKLASTVFILGLASIDFVTSLVIMPFVIVSERLNYFHYYDFFCKVYAFLLTSGVPYSALIMVAIAVDRYICICHPHCHALDARRAKITILCLGGVAALLGSVTAMSVGVYSMKPVGPDGEVWGSRCPCQNCTQELVWDGRCRGNQLLIPESFRKVYQKFYAGIYLLAFVVVAVLYIIIYRSVLGRRSARMKQRKQTRAPGGKKAKKQQQQQQQAQEKETALTALTEAEPPATNGKASPCAEAELEEPSRKALAEKDSAVREKYLLANIKTALMLFIVTLVFLIAFLPSWLMAHQVITMQKIVYFMYFVYNSSNPIIYAFMNPAFRRELRDVISCRKCRRAAY